MNAGERDVQSEAVAACRKEQSNQYFRGMDLCQTQDVCDTSGMHTATKLSITSVRE